jgi:hypothetical protein
MAAGFRSTAFYHRKAKQVKTNGAFGEIMITQFV